MNLFTSGSRFGRGGRTTSSRLASRIWKTSSQSGASESTAPAATSSATSPQPPEARREEDRVIYAGVAPKGWNPKVPRQSDTSTEKLLDPPVAVPDPYGWMRDDKRENPQVLEHLKLENEYSAAMTAHLESLRQDLYKEMLSSIQETDYTLPRPRGQYYYYSRSFEGKSYSVHCRAPKSAISKDLQELLKEWDGSADTPVLPQEEITLDINELAKDKPYCDVGKIEFSPSEKLMAYTVDFTGNEKCQLVVVDLTTGKIVDQDPKLSNIYGLVEFGTDDDILFYLENDDIQRPFQVYRRNLKTGTNELLFQEDDEQFWVGFSKSLDEHYLFVETASTETSEIYFLDLQNGGADAELQCIAKRRQRVLYEVDHRKGSWWITARINDTPNLRLFTAPAKPNCQDDWTLVTDPTSKLPLFDGGLDRALSYFATFESFCIAEGREGGIPKVWILSLDQATGKVVSMMPLTFDEAAHDVGLISHSEFDTPDIVVAYNSLITPLEHIQVKATDPSVRTILKTKSVPGYQKEDYQCENFWVRSRDGVTDIPVNMVYRKDVMEKFLQGKTLPTHMYGYGAYGSCTEADFSATRLTLLNRGMVFVQPQVRGGGEMGRQWYEEPNGAKYLCKKNTFNDFVDVARYLINDKKLTTPSQLSCEGRSAGGMLIGGVINQAPELFKVAILGVPFVDVVHTMLDASIPLTTSEWEEWGNPSEEKYFQYMMEYSPTCNVQNAIYPACLLTGGLHDPRVPYWEPAKLAAILRHTQASGSGPVCVKLEMSAGHFSASDRYKYLRELAFSYSFLLDQHGLVNEKEDP